jgi:hypothetical protein
MNTRSVRFAAAVTLTLAATATRVHAQSAPGGFFVGAGAGMSLVGEPTSEASHLGEALHLRAGWTLGPRAALVLEAGMSGFDSVFQDSTLVGVGPADGPYYQYFPRTLKTQTVLASLQLGVAGSLYVRPGAGLARHAFLVSEPLASDMFVQATKWETAPAVGLAVGRRVPIPGFPLDLEATAGWSGHQDNTRSRWSAGLQVVRVIHF